MNIERYKNYVKILETYIKNVNYMIDERDKVLEYLNRNKYMLSPFSNFNYIFAVNRIKEMNSGLIEYITGIDDCFQNETITTDNEFNSKIYDNYGLLKRLIDYRQLLSGIKYDTEYRKKICKELALHLKLDPDVNINDFLFSFVNKCYKNSKEIVDLYLLLQYKKIECIENNREYDQEIKEMAYQLRYLEIELVRYVDEEIYLHLKNTNSENLFFKDMYEHFSYLNKLGHYQIEINSDEIFIKSKNFTWLKERYITKADNKSRLFHGTSIEGAKQIFCDKYMKTNRIVQHFNFNKVFFASEIDSAKDYGLVGGVYSKVVGKDRYIILEADLSDYEVYYHKHQDVYFVWGEVSTDAIRKIYLCEKEEIIKEISREELMEL